LNYAYDTHPQDAKQAAKIEHRLLKQDGIYTQHKIFEFGYTQIL
jgi:hypothetical protein